MIKKKNSFLCRLLFITILSLGIILNVSKVTSAKKILSYYTLQVNIFCLIAFIILELVDILKIKYQKYNFYYIIKGQMIIGMVIMLIIYIVALAPNHFQMYQTSNKLANILVHIVAPIIVIIDYILFDQKGKLKSYYPFIWISIPLVYVIFVYVYSSKGGTFYSLGGSRKYAYLFLDIEKYGYIKVGIWLTILTVAVILLGYVLILIDRIICKKESLKNF